jgi:hypothetical protein
MNQDAHDRLTELEKDFVQLKKAVAENTRITNEINNTTGELLELFKTAKGGFRAAYWLGNFLKWTFGIIAAGAAAYVAAREFLGK